MWMRTVRLNAASTVDGNYIGPWKRILNLDVATTMFAQLEDGKIASSQIPCTRGNVTILSDSNTITIPFTPSDSAKLMVYQNGLLLSETIHYTVSGATLTLVNYNAEVGDVFQFIII